MQIAQPLQNQKIILLKLISIAKAQQRVFTSYTKMPQSIDAELASFIIFKE